MYKEQNNIVLIDRQNLVCGTKSEGWSIDMQKFFTYLKERWGAKESHCFIGYYKEEFQDLYETLQRIGFILHYRPHSYNLSSNKKGNVDSDIVFTGMRLLCKNKNDFNKIVLVSGDGDFIRLIRYAIQEDKFLKIIFPNQKYSSLYRPLGNQYYSFLYHHKDKLKKV